MKVPRLWTVAYGRQHHPAIRLTARLASRVRTFAYRLAVADHSPFICP